MTDINTEFNSSNPFFALSVGIGKTAFARYEKDGYTKDSEGFYICPECGSRASHISSVFGCMMPCDCECKKQKKAAKEKEKHMTLIEERRRRCFESENMRYHTFERDNGINPNIASALKNYVLHFEHFRTLGRGLLLHGKTGTGKSFFASCTANALTDLGYTVRQTTFSRLQSKLSQTYDKQSIIDSYSRADLVFLDDIGTEHKSDYMKQLMFDVIDSFYNSLTPMIITTNLSMHEMKAPADNEYARIYQRIFERCTCIGVENENQRLRNIVDGYVADCEILGIKRN